MSIKKADNVDSQKIRLIPQLVDGMAQLHKLIVTGNLETGEPGLLESVRKIRDDVAEIRNKQTNFAELERRVAEIEERHKRVDEQKKRWDTYQVMIFGLIVTNIIDLIMGWIGLK